MTRNVASVKVSMSKLEQALPYAGFMPHGAKIVAVEWDGFADQLCLLVEHPSLPPVEDGCVPTQFYPPLLEP